MLNAKICMYDSSRICILINSPGLLFFYFFDQGRQTFKIVDDIVSAAVSVEFCSFCIFGGPFTVFLML